MDEVKTMLNIYNTSPEVADSLIDTVVIPFGSIEGKGPHLPIGTDFLVADAFATAYAEQHDSIYLLPTLPFATSEAHRHFGGTIYLDTDTLWDILTDLVESLNRQDFQQIILLNFCSYNWVIKPATRELNLRQGWADVVWVEPKQFLQPVLSERFPNLVDYHAGLVDTSLMIYLYPERVGEIPNPHQPSVGREFIDYTGLRAIAPNGVWGNPGLASRELGEDLFRQMLIETRKYIEKAFQVFGQ